jgi:hypothetical protein
MSYVDKYRVQWTNDLSQEIVILFSQKDGTDTGIQDYAAVEVKLSYNGQEDKMFPIYGCSLSVKFDMRETDIDYWNDFVNADADEWKVSATMDGIPCFDGFVLQDEGQVPFQDKPYDAVITATDGIGLLRDIPLRYNATTNFDGHNSIIRYIAFALQQTGLFLPILVFDNVYHRSFLNRDDDPKWDFFGQAYLEARTFLKDAVTFTDCYNALEIILKDTYRLSYSKGAWFIIRIPTIQYTAYSSYYTSYDYNGLNPVGHLYDQNYGTVGKNELIYPINENQLKSVRKGNKSTKTIFNYVQWPEIPKNNKFERGTLTGQGTAYDDYDLDGDHDTTEILGTYKTYTIDDWNYGTYSGFPSQEAVLPTLTGTTAKAYRRSVKNNFDVEVLREIILEEVPTGTHGMLISEGIPVIKGDKIEIAFDYRTNRDASGTQQIAMIFIIPDGGGTKTVIESQNTSIMNPYFWQTATAGSFISRFYEAGENVNQYVSINVDPPEIPISGKLYIGFITPGISGSLTYIKNVQVTYTPYVAGGYIAVKGDYWIQEQSKNFKDVSESEVFISDNTHKVLKGCLLDSAGVPLTADWYRMGMSESLSYTQITNIGKFNLEYRRFQFIEGAWTGTLYAPVNYQENQQPISLHKAYRLVDIPGEDRRFIITAPLEINLDTGENNCRFSEVAYYNPVTQHRVESVRHLRDRIVENINNTTEAQWNSASGAPAHGTAGFPPLAFIGGFWLGDAEDSFGVLLDPGHAITCSTAALGGGSPVLTKYYDITYTATDGHTYRMALFQIGAALRVGNVFTVTAYGHNAATAVVQEEFLLISDGLQFGDVRNELKYIF